MAPKVPCNHCAFCEKGQYPLCTNVRERLPGGFAEYIAVPESLVKNGTYRLPDGISYDQSTFIEPLACVVRAQRLAAVAEGMHVMVIGCGMSGLLHVQLAKSRGCRVTAIDINPGKLAMAGRFGAETASMRPATLLKNCRKRGLEKPMWSCYAPERSVQWKQPGPVWKRAVRSCSLPSPHRTSR